MKRKWQCSRIAFCVNLAQLFTPLYLRTLWKMFPSKNTYALICFSSTIDENADTVHLIEGYVFKWKSHTLGKFVEKKQGKLKTQGRNASYKFKSKVVVICRNIQHFTGTVL